LVKRGEFIFIRYFMRKIFDKKIDKKIWQPALIILLFIFLIATGLIVNFYRVQQARGGASHNIHGWLWSENMGWLNTNCYNDYNNDGIMECCCAGGPGGDYCPGDAVACPSGVVPGGVAAGDYGVNADIDSVTASNVLNGYAWAENYADWNNATTIADASRGYLCFGATCGGTAPNGLPAWACAGTRKANGSCLRDCGQEFNYQETCTQPNVVVDSTLLGHWTLDAVVNIGGTYKTLDKSGKGLDAILGSPPANPIDMPRLATGNFKQDTVFTAALSYDTDDNPSTVNRVYAEVLDTSTLGLTQNFTLEGWINLKQDPVYPYNSAQIMLRKDGAYALGVIPTTYNKFAAEFFMGGGWRTYYFSDADFANNYVNKWRHVALTYDGSYVRLYLDGVLDRIYAQAGPINTVNPLPLYLGGDKQNPLPPGAGRASIAPNAAYLDGYLDNVAIYSRVKTNQEIWQDAHKEITGWARVITADLDDGWIGLHGKSRVTYDIYIPNTEIPDGTFSTEDQMWGVYLNDHSQGGGYYTLGGRYRIGASYYNWRTWVWGPDDSLGWASGSHLWSEAPPKDFDSFDAVNINPIEGKVTTQLNWSASKNATYYIFWRCHNQDNTPCDSNYSSYPVPYYACNGDQCSTNDTYDLNPNSFYCYKMQAWNWEGSKWNTHNPPTYPRPYCMLTSPLQPSSDVLVNGNICGQLQTIWNPTVDEEATVDGYNLYRGLKNTPGVGCNSSLTDPNCLLVAHAGEGVKSSDLSAQWRMNESGWSGQSNEVIDASGNQNNGTASGSATTTATNAKFIRSGIFSGGYVTVLDSDSLDFTASDSLTIAGWVRTSAVSGELLYKIQKPNGSGYEIYLSSGRPVCHFFKNPGQNYTLTSSTAINDSNWHYVACVVNRSSGLLKVFVDNNFDSSTLDVSTMGDISNDQNVIIGESFTGMLDNWTVAKEVRSHTDLLLEAESQPISSICNITANQSFKYGTSQTIYACSSGDKCCAMVDKRGNPNTMYYYWLTQTAGSVESSAKAPLTGCNLAKNANYRYGCDKTVCQPRVNTKEK